MVEPLLDAARRDGRRLRCLCEVGADYRGLTAGAAWEDVRLGLRAMGLFDGCAVVSDVVWIREASRLAAFFMPCPVRVFDERDRSAAAAWLAALPEGAGRRHPAGPRRRCRRGRGRRAVANGGPRRPRHDGRHVAGDARRPCRAWSCTPGPSPAGRTSVPWCGMCGSWPTITAGSAGVALAVDGALAELAPSVAEPGRAAAGTPVRLRRARRRGRLGRGPGTARDPAARTDGEAGDRPVRDAVAS